MLFVDVMPLFSSSIGGAEGRTDDASLDAPVLFVDAMYVGGAEGRTDDASLDAPVLFVDAMYIGGAEGSYNGATEGSTWDVLDLLARKRLLIARIRAMVFLIPRTNWSP